jgi:molybdate transport system regulatory protein
MFERTANIFCGPIADVRRTPIVSEVTIDLGNDKRLCAVVTTESFDKLGVSLGASIVGIVKPTDIVIVKADGDPLCSTRNRFAGRVASVTPQGVALSVTGLLDDDTPLRATITAASAAALDLRVGARVYFLFKALHVILTTG